MSIYLLIIDLLSEWYAYCMNNTQELFLLRLSMQLSSLNMHQCISESYLHSNILTDWKLTYDQLSAGTFESFLREISFDGIQVYEERFKPSMFQRGEAKSNSLCLGFFSEMAAPALWMGKQIIGHEILSVCNQDEILLRSPENCSFYSLTVPFELLDDHEFDQHYSKCSNVIADQYAEIYHKKFLTLLDHVLNNAHFIVNNATKQQLKSDILDLSNSFIQVLNQHQEAKKISCQRAKQVVMKVSDILESDKDKCYSIEDLCQMTFTSRRTLQNCFEQMTGQSPALFLKKLKLNAVRRTLLNADESVTVSDAATEWGFWHLSQFAVDYKKFFGESPSQTLMHKHAKRVLFS